MTTTPSADDQAYLAAFRGSFIAALRWPQLDGLWEANYKFDRASLLAI